MPINPSPAVLRANRLLWHLARRPAESYSISELARMTGIPRASCDSVLQALADCGLVVRREPELRYALGDFCIALGDAAREANPVLHAAGREAEELARRLSACV
ncbi:MarR family transcriptional regulator, partial [Actinomadura adrarensis]